MQGLFCSQVRNVWRRIRSENVDRVGSGLYKYDVMGGTFGGEGERNSGPRWRFSEHLIGHE